ncbi:glycosyltransferase involved in cell wall biosynthesis [Lutibacter sp. Hel_I_33_5]|uniref:glycosyltransferase family 4 protein n=1 Tax=Lutibacter sp. Hel_I_33_5 TaxID=1566289 RepID=UPI0011AB0C95|nr:glycosyltransferase family 4 protein [Lutibacter sp. Hel_I_33_5]TVZ55720.1 glycosyltransferase involved in cell wall biosynthesis [Lutibacter sp. Hel_I_33_5]
MKALIITYYWPPSGGSGVQRWLKFVKYLQDYNIEPIVYTVDNPSYAIVDSSLEEEVPKNITILKKSIKEPNTIFSFFKSNKAKTSAGFLDSKPTFFVKMLQYIRANYFIPDARKFWIKPSIKYLKEYLTENKVDIIITTGPPHSLHLIGLQIKKDLGVKWISDFRDPWTEIDYFHQLPLTEKSKKKHISLEKEVIKNSDAVLVVGKTMKENFSSLSNNIHVVTNGFDAEIGDEKVKVSLGKRFTITHVGLMNADRNPFLLWKVLQDICLENKGFQTDLEIKLIGKIANEVKDAIAVFEDNNVNVIDYVSHDEVKKHQQSSQVLLLAINKVPSAKGIITGKIFEYLQAKRPILAIGPTDGDAAEIINSTNTGITVGYEDKEVLKETILKFYNDYKNNKLLIVESDINKFHRKELTKKLANIIVETVKG